MFLLNLVVSLHCNRYFITRIWQVFRKMSSNWQWANIYPDCLLIMYRVWQVFRCWWREKSNTGGECWTHDILTTRTYNNTMYLNVCVKKYFTCRLNVKLLRTFWIGPTTCPNCFLYTKKDIIRTLLNSVDISIKNW